MPIRDCVQFMQAPSSGGGCCAAQHTQRWIERGDTEVRYTGWHCDLPRMCPASGLILSATSTHHHCDSLRRNMTSIFRCTPCECGGYPDCSKCGSEEAIIYTNFFIQYDDQREDFEEKHEALRRAAALSKFKKAVIKVYDKHGTFIKSFDGR